MWTILTRDKCRVDRPIPRSRVRGRSKVVGFSFDTTCLRAVDAEADLAGSVEGPANDDTNFRAVIAGLRVENTSLAPVEGDRGCFLAEDDHVGSEVTGFVVGH